MADLRELAHGLFPAALDEEGLAAAIEVARRGMSHGSSPGALPGGRFAPPIESAAYFLVDEALRLAPTRRRRRRHAPRRRTADRRAARGLGARALAVRVEDRIGAVGGTFIATAHHVRAELPCALVIADDEMLLREGLARLLEDAGFEIAGRCGDADALLRMVEARRPDVAIVDIRMPPNHRDDGLLAAQEIRRRHPEIGVLVLSHHLESRYAMRLLEEAPERAGYLLKERVSDVAVLADALRRIDEGECVVDPTIVSRLVARKRRRGPLDDAHRPRARRPRPGRRRPLQRRDRRAAVPLPQDRRVAHLEDLPQARPAASQTATGASSRCSPTYGPRSSSACVTPYANRRRHNPPSMASRPREVEVC